MCNHTIEERCTVSWTNRMLDVDCLSSVWGNVNACCAPVDQLFEPDELMQIYCNITRVITKTAGVYSIGCNQRARLSLRINHQRPPACLRYDDAVINRDRVIGKAINGPVPNKNRVAQHTRQLERFRAWNPTFFALWCPCHCCLLPEEKHQVVCREWDLNDLQPYNWLQP